MSVVTYVYSLTTDFPNGLISNELHKILSESVAISVQFVGINTYDDVVEILYETSLSGAEELELNSIISAYAPSNGAQKTNFYHVYPNMLSITSLSWTTVGVFKYGGSNEKGLINYFDVISKTSSALTSYDVRVVDSTNGTILCSVSNLDNTAYQLNDLGVISNIPEDEAMLEIQMKRNGLTTVYIQALIVYVNNA